MAKIAVIKTGGKQYKVKEGDILSIEKISGKEGDKVELEVLMIADDDAKEVSIGRPVLDAKKVAAKIEKQFKDKKITVIKYKAKVRYRRKKGHRQNLTKVKIEKI